MSENKYKRVCTNIAAVVIMNTLLLQFVSAFAMMVAPALDGVIRNISVNSGIDYSDLYYAVDQTAMLITYLACFMIPAFIFRFINRREGCEPMRLAVKLPADTPLVIIAAIGVVFTSAYLNSLMVSFIDFSSLMASEPLNTPVKILMAFISTAIVPAVCEEFLFRGCVLSNLLPYGKTTALIGSALLFALMHGNFAQFFYTFMAGLVLGAVYLETGSIWAPTFIHLFNNFYSVAQQVIYEKGGETFEMNIIIFFIDVALPFAGLALAAFLIYKRVKRGLRVDAEPTRSVKLDRGTLVKGFLNPAMIAHIAISVGFALLIVFMAMSEPMMY